MRNAQVHAVRPRRARHSRRIDLHRGRCDAAGEGQDRRLRHQEVGGGVPARRPRQGDRRMQDLPPLKQERIYPIFTQQIPHSN